jgi:hypothetical protein
MLMTVSPVDMTMADACAVPDDRALLVVMVMRSRSMALVSVVAAMMPVAMPMLSLGERDRGGGGEQSSRAQAGGEQACNFEHFRTPLGDAQASGTVPE